MDINDSLPPLESEFQTITFGAKVGQATPELEAMNSGTILGRQSARHRDSLRHLKIIILRNVRDADDEDAHLATGTVDDAGRDVDEGTLADGLLHAV